MNGLIHIFHSHANQRTSAFRNHRHTAFEISLILRGEGNYLSGETNFPIRSGDIFLYHSNEAHCITDIVTPSGMEILNIHFESRFFWSTAQEAQCLQTFFQRSKRKENRIPVGTPLNQSLLTHILACDEEQTKKQKGYETAIRIHLLSVLVLLFRDEPKGAKENVRDYDESKLLRINDSMDYICNHYAEPITLEQLAKQSGFGKTYYSTVFKQLNGMSPWDYLLIKRIEASMQMLRTSSETVLNIALFCGFNNTANFNRIFRNVTGMSPKEYRASNQK